MFVVIVVEDCYCFDFESKVYVFVFVGQLLFGKYQLVINLLFGLLYYYFDVVGWLIDSLLVVGFRLDQVLIEVIEIEVIICFDQFCKVFKVLCVVGMKLVIDDFGVGYFGLLLLICFQFDKIKVDVELVCDIYISGIKQVIVVLVVCCCEDFGIMVVVEGVEILEEWCWLQLVGICLFQGFFFF